MRWRLRRLQRRPPPHNDRRSPLRLPGSRRVHPVALTRRKPRDPGPPGAMGRLGPPEHQHRDRGPGGIPPGWHLRRRQSPPGPDRRHADQSHLAGRHRLGRADHPVRPGLRDRLSGRHDVVGDVRRKLGDQRPDPAVHCPPRRRRGYARAGPAFGAAGARPTRRNVASGNDRRPRRLREPVQHPCRRLAGD